MVNPFGRRWFLAASLFSVAPSHAAHNEDSAPLACARVFWRDVKTPGVADTAFESFATALAKQLSYKISVTDSTYPAAYRSVGLGWLRYNLQGAVRKAVDPNARVMMPAMIAHQNHPDHAPLFAVLREVFPDRKFRTADDLASLFFPGRKFLRTVPAAFDSRENVERAYRAILKTWPAAYIDAAAEYWAIGNLLRIEDLEARNVLWDDEIYNPVLGALLIERLSPEFFDRLSSLRESDVELVARQTGFALSDLELSGVVQRAQVIAREWFADGKREYAWQMLTRKQNERVAR